MLGHTFECCYHELKNLNIVAYIFCHLDQPTITVLLDIGRHMFDCKYQHKFEFHFLNHIQVHISDLYTLHISRQLKNMLLHTFCQYHNRKIMDQMSIY